MYIYLLVASIIIFAFSLRQLVKDAHQAKKAPTPLNLIRCSLKRDDWLYACGIWVSILILALSLCFYFLPIQILQAPFIYFLLTIVIMFSILTIFNAYKWRYSKNLLRVGRKKHRHNYYLMISGAILSTISVLFLAISFPLFTHIQLEQTTHNQFEDCVGKYYSNAKIENNYASGNDNRHNDTPQKLTVTKHFIKGHNNGELTFKYRIKNAHYDKLRNGIVLNGHFIKKGSWLKNNQMINADLSHRNNTILIGTSASNNILRIDLYGTNLDYSFPYTPSLENLNNNNEAFARR